MTESYPLPSGRDPIADAVEWNGFVEELKRQWRLLWRERIDDKVRAEGISSKDFELLFVVFSFAGVLGLEAAGFFTDSCFCSFFALLTSFTTFVPVTG